MTLACGLADDGTGPALLDPAQELLAEAAVQNDGQRGAIVGVLRQRQACREPHC
jgi:hypothetical protein